MELNDTRILITGASSGIGAALGLELARRGAAVGLVARRRDRLDTLLAECSAYAPQSRAFTVDLADLNATEQLAAQAIEAWGHVDAVVNNAAIPKRVPFTQLTMNDVEATMRVNFLSPAQLTLALLPHMIARQQGLIINVSSMGGRIPIPNESAYNASKFALAGWTEAMRIDLEGTGVNVKLILPGPIDTEIWDQPGNIPALFEIEKVSAADCAREIADAMTDKNGFEYYTPPTFPGGMDAKAMVVDKHANCDQYINGMAAFARSMATAPST